MNNTASVVAISLSAERIADNPSMRDELSQAGAPVDFDQNRATWLFRLPALPLTTPVELWPGVTANGVSNGSADVDRLPLLQTHFVDQIRKARSPIEWTNAETIFAPLPPYQWLVEGLQLGPGRINVVGALPSAGKTVFAQALAVCVASGRNVFDDVAFRVNGSGAVGHIDHDQGMRVSMERYQAICVAYGIDGAEFIRTNRLRYSYRPSLFADENTPAALDRWKFACDGLDLLVIDSLFGLVPGKEQSKPEFAAGLYMLNEVSETTGTTILACAHSPKPLREKGTRKSLEHTIMGSVQNSAVCGAIFDLSYDKNQNRIVTMAKPNLLNKGHTVEKFGLVFESKRVPGSDVEGLHVTTRTIEQLDAKAANKPIRHLDTLMHHILKFIQKGQGCSVNAMLAGIRDIKGSRDDKLGARDELMRRGYLTQERTGTGRATPYCLRSTPAGDAWLMGQTPKEER